jgi:DNA-binding transcriptional LysR family regulator
MSALNEELPSVLASFMSQHPEIKVETEEQLSGDTVRALVEGLADIGVFAAGTPTHGLTVAPFESDELVVICPNDSPLARRDEVDFRACLEFPFVGLNRGSSLLGLSAVPRRTRACPAAARAGPQLRRDVQDGRRGSRHWRAAARGLQAVAVRVRPDRAAPGRRVGTAPIARSLQRRRPLSPAVALLWEHLSRPTGR